MKRVTFTNAMGEEVELYRSPFFLTKIEGLGDVEAEIQTQKAPGQDGSTPIDTTLNERYISIEVDILKDFEYNRSKLSKIFNPRLGEGILTYENNRTKVEIRAIAEHVPKFPDNRPVLTQKAMINLRCPNPLFEDVFPTSIKLEDFVEKFSFPFSFPVRFASRGDSRIIINNGHVPTPVKITFNGDAVNPKITNNTTGEFIKVNRTIPEGYSLVINTSFGNKEVKIVAPDGVEENAFHYIDIESTFFMLAIGPNELSFITDGGKPELYIEYKNKFVGV